MNGTANEFMKIIQSEMNDMKEIYLPIDSRFENDNFVFNYWVARTFYKVSENFDEFEDLNLVTFRSTNDVGFVIDADEENNDLSIYIVHCFYLTNNSICTEDIDNFIRHPLEHLFFNEYTNEKLKSILSKYENNLNYTIYDRFYFSRPEANISKNITEYFEEFRKNTTFKYNVMAKLISLDKMKALYYNEQETKKDFKYDIPYTNKNRLIKLPAAQGEKEDNVDTIFFAVKVSDLYELLKASKEEKYELFDENIREYLGTKNKAGRVNKNIESTLENPIERNRFFYYNNGITMICQKSIAVRRNGKNFITVENPQIVNGCQTINSIASVFDRILANCDKKDCGKVVNEFKHCLVLTKIYQLNKDVDFQNVVYKNIVKYTNMQTAITPKDFVSSQKYFKDLQISFEKYGFKLSILQSDKYQFESNMEKFNKFKEISNNTYNLIRNCNISKPNDIIIPLENLLRALMAFYFSGHDAFRNSCYLLKETSQKYYINFSKCVTDYFNIESMIVIYLIFLKSGGSDYGRKGRYPVPYYVLDFIGRKIKFDDNGEYNYKKVNQKLKYMISSKDCFEQIYEFFSDISEAYSKKYIKKYEVDYSLMTKSAIDQDIIDEVFSDKLKEANKYKQNYYLEFIS